MLDYVCSLTGYLDTRRWRLCGRLLRVCERGILSLLGCSTSIERAEWKAFATPSVPATGAEEEFDRPRFSHFVTLMCILFFSGTSIAGQPPAIDGPFLDQSEVTWKVNEFNVARWKTLVGGIEGGQINRDDIQFGIWELAPNAIYHSHRHEVPEIYFVTQGKADWTLDGVTREVGPGMTIYSKSGAPHKMVNKSNDNVKAIWVWWAPDGDKNVFAGDYEFIEPAPEKNGSFDKGLNQQLY
jgi:mannose-6-phosphate isomerase-like protein (cupin superfamily)